MWVIEQGIKDTSENLKEASFLAFKAENCIADLDGLLNTVPHIEAGSEAYRAALAALRDLARETDAALKVHIAALEADKQGRGQEEAGRLAPGF